MTERSLAETLSTAGAVFSIMVPEDEPLEPEWAEHYGTLLARGGAALRSVDRLLYLVENAHEGYHRKPDNPRAACEICRELDRLESRNDR